MSARGAAALRPRERRLGAGGRGGARSGAELGWWWSWADGDVLVMLCW